MTVFGQYADQEGETENSHDGIDDIGHGGNPCPTRIPPDALRQDPPDAHHPDRPIGVVIMKPTARLRRKRRFHLRPVGDFPDVEVLDLLHHLPGSSMTLKIPCPRVISSGRSPACPGPSPSPLQ